MKLSDLSDLGDLVFSTNKNLPSDSDDAQETLPPNKQQLQAVFSNKGRGGKTVTIIKGFVGTNNDLKALAKLLKQACGVGGAVKEDEIIIQGNYRDKIMQLLKEKGYQVKRVGG